MSDVMEAMARGGGLIDAMAQAAYGSMGFVVPWDHLVPQVKAKWRRGQIAAIRAVTERGGLVVGKMPEEWSDTGNGSQHMQAFYDGHNHALAAVRAIKETT